MEGAFVAPFLLRKIIATEDKDSAVKNSSSALYRSRRVISKQYSFGHSARSITSKSENMFGGFMRSFVLVLSMVALLCSSALAQNGVWVNYTTANSNLYCDTVMAIDFDGSNNLWLSTWRGADKFDGTSWTSYYRDAAHIPSNDVSDINFSNNSVWFAHHAGLTKYDGTAWTQYTTVNSGLVNSPVLMLANDHNNLWIGTARGLNKLDAAGNWSNYKVANTPAIPYDGYAAIATDPNDNVWLAFISNRNLVVFPNGNSSLARRIKMDTIPNIPTGYPTSLVVDRGGSLWAGLAHNGAVRMNASGATSYTTLTTNEFKNNNTNDIAVDQCGKVWVATEGGAGMFDGTNWTFVTRSGGNLLDDYVYTISVDRYGHVWFGTKGGVSEFKPYPEKPYLIYPANWATITTDSVFCHWTQSCPSILKYWYELADNPNFTNSKIDTTSASLMVNTSHWDTILQNNGTYYWRVKAKNDAGWGPFSDTWSFTVNKPVQRVGMHSNFDCDLSIFPNPTEFGVIFRFTLPTRERYTVTITDESGKAVRTPVTDIQDAGAHEIPLSSIGLANGSYRVTLSGEDISASTTLIVLR